MHPARRHHPRHPPRAWAAVMMQRVGGAPVRLNGVTGPQLHAGLLLAATSSRPRARPPRRGEAPCHGSCHPFRGGVGSPTSSAPGLGRATRTVPSLGRSTSRAPSVRALRGMPRCKAVGTPLECIPMGVLARETGQGWSTTRKSRPPTRTAPTLGLPTTHAAPRPGCLVVGTLVSGLARRSGLPRQIIMRKGPWSFPGRQPLWPRCRAAGAMSMTRRWCTWSPACHVSARWPRTRSRSGSTNLTWMKKTR
mmetsp:Transcript_54215/g.124318  ORF Transcript_54215/g.124318 Transcript_54215/m.124318 type:complete len:250 (-) Transcript_54215:542-1291(-)